MNIATCIGCGCDDHHACGEGCYWLRVDRAHLANLLRGRGHSINKQLTQTYRRVP